MKPRRAAPFALFVLLAIAAFSAFSPGSAQAEKKMPSCIRFWGQVVATAVGYNHVVGIQNSCDSAALCTVSTDVAPDPIQATVPAKQKTELTTFRGSPASTFTPKVECTFP